MKVKKSWVEPVVDFFGARSQGYSAALFRIAYGLLAIWTAVGVQLNQTRYYTDEGMIPWARVKHFKEQIYSVLTQAPEDPEWVRAVTMTYLVAAVLYTVGFVPRFWSLVIFVVNVALQHRNPYTVNGGDRLFLILGLLGALMPLGQRWSVDAWIRAKLGWEYRPTTVWSQRIIGLQISYIYLFSCFAKLAHRGWWKGQALFFVLSSEVFAEWPVEIHFTPFIAAMTYGTLLFEWLLPLVVWLPRYRLPALAAGILFHIGIDVFMLIPMFSAVMVVSYSCYLTDEETLRVVNFVLRPLGVRLGPDPSELGAAGLADQGAGDGQSAAAAQSGSAAQSG
ncbi:MAG TPA: HTTM domain-containing protein [Polyangiaceae bacterium]|nr:HTTM domain-containing protein [Polyangiaceae bacterium]